MANFYSLKFDKNEIFDADFVYHQVNENDNNVIDIYAIDPINFQHVVFKDEAIHPKFSYKGILGLEGKTKILCAINVPGDDKAKVFVIKHNNGVSLFKYKALEDHRYMNVDMNLDGINDFNTLVCDKLNPVVNYAIFEHRKNQHPGNLELLITSEGVTRGPYLSFQPYQPNFINADMTIAKTTSTDEKLYVFRTNSELRIVAGHTDMSRGISCCEKRVQEKWAKVVFADLTGQSHYDIVFFNNTGVYVYQQISQKNQYELISFNPKFSELHGWTPDLLDTIHFHDVYMDPRQEMILTSPKGLSVLSFDYYSKEWNSILDQTELSIPDRTGKVVGVITNPVSGQVLVATKVGSTIKYGKFISQQTTEEVEKVIESDIADIMLIPQTTVNMDLVPPSDNSEYEREQFHLSDYFIDYSSIINSVDKSTGKPIISFPLIDFISPLTNIKVNVVYDANVKTSNTLGVGWSIQLQNFIVFDHQSNMFPEDEKFILVFQNRPYNLKRNIEKSTNDIIHFNFEIKFNFRNDFKNSRSSRILENDDSDVTVRYFRNDERWEIDIKGMKHFYGRTDSTIHDDAIIWELVWDNWRGIGNSNFSQKQIATGWYLSKIEDCRGNNILFKYNTTHEFVPNHDNTLDNRKKFTREIYLEKIYDSYSNEIIFNYQSKEKSEYSESNLVESSEFYDKSILSKKYIESMCIKTSKFYYNLYFKYVVCDNKRYLINIQEGSDKSRTSVLDFYYSTLYFYMLNEVTLPSSASVIFQYTISKPTYKSLQTKKQIPIKSDYRINYGTDFILLHHRDTETNQTVLQMFDNMTQDEIIPLNESSGERKWPTISSTTYYYIRRLENAIALVAHTQANESWVYLFFKKNYDWCTTSEPLKFNKNTIIDFSDNYLLAVSDKITIHTLTEDGFWIEEIVLNQGTQMNLNNKDNMAINTKENHFYVYDNNYIWMGYKNAYSKWNIEMVMRNPQVLTQTHNVLEKFELDDDTKPFYKMLLSHYTLQSYKNIVMLNQFTVEGTKLMGDLVLYVLNGKRQVSNIDHRRIEILDIMSINEENKIQHKNGQFTTFHCGYKLQNDKFVLDVKDFTGYARDQSDSQIKKYTESMKSSSGMATIRFRLFIEIAKQNQKDIVKRFIDTNSGKLFLLRNTLYSKAPQLSGQIVFANMVKFTFNGFEWYKTANDANLKQKSSDMNLGTEYVLQKDSDLPTYYLTDRTSGKQLAAIQVDSLEDILIRYPVYLAYQKDSETIGIVQFYENKRIETNELVAGKLSKLSGYNVMATEQNGNIKFWTHVGMNHLLNTPTVSTSHVSYGTNIERVTGYKYDHANVFAIDGVIQFAKRDLIPGGKMQQFGYIEEFRNLTRNFYNSKGELVETKIWKKQDENNIDYDYDDDTADPETILYDQTGIYEIARFLPYRLKDDAIGYFGFEDYELNVAGEPDYISPPQSKKWIFDENQIIKNDYSFTGSNYLRLSSANLRASFIPINQNEIYVVSCWLRSDNLQLGAVYENLKIMVDSKSESINNGKEIVILGEIKLKSRNWFYVEALINLPYIKKMKLLDLTTVATIQIYLEATASIIDIDHIRFSPLSCEFEAYVYNTKTKDISERILINGLIKRYLYDKYQQQIAYINEHGQIKEFNTYTKHSMIDYSKNMKSFTGIKPVQAIYEVFDSHSFQDLWKVDEAKTAWKIKPNSIKHVAHGAHSLTADFSEFNKQNIGFRFNYNLMNDGQIHFDSNLTLKSLNTSASLIFNGNPFNNLPLKGEIVIIINNNRTLIWIDGCLLVDEVLHQQLFQSNIIKLQVENNVQIRNVMVFDDPAVHITYLNQLGEKIQEAFLESENSAIFIEYLYDELGRQDIITKRSRVVTTNGQESLMKYRSKFVINKNPSHLEQIWETGQLEGEAGHLNGPFGYTRIIFEDNPLNNKNQLGLPGHKFSVNSTFAKLYSSTFNNQEILNLYPPQSHTYRVEIKPGNIYYVTIMNDKEQTTARYIQGPNDYQLITYEYNENNKLTKVLPPIYHDRLKTIDQSDKIKAQQKQLGTHIRYDSNGNIITKQTPETARTDYEYDKYNLLKFLIHYSDYNGKHIDNVLYFDYDDFGRLIETGRLINLPESKADLDNFATQENKKKYQEFHFSDYELQPVLRSRISRYITYVDDSIPFIEELTVNEDEETANRRIIIPSGEDDSTVAIDLRMVYQQQKVREIVYPAEFNEIPFHLVYAYDKLGRISSIGIPGDNTYFGQFQYDASNQITKETHTYSKANPFSRIYEYNEPGYLTKISDKYLSEDIFYTEGSYGGVAQGDGTVTKTLFNAKWHKLANTEKLSLKPEQFPPGCFDQLKRTGYINELNQPEKIYYPDLELQMPFNCTSDDATYQIISSLERHGFPAQYGHSYEYNYLQQLTKAKYFSGEENTPEPLTSKLFFKHSHIPLEESKKIWDYLKQEGYIVEHSKYSTVNFYFMKLMSLAHVNTPNISHDLKLAIQKVFANYYSKNKTLTYNDFRPFLSQWSDMLDNNRLAQGLWNQLTEMDQINNPISQHFLNVLHHNKTESHNIISFLFNAYGKELGKAFADVEYFDIDKNGNHKLYQKGLKTYELKYEELSNKITSIVSKDLDGRETAFNFEHDSHGNVVSAEHKNITKIEYCSVSNRVIKITIMNGNTIHFAYDALGGRIMKRILSPTNEILKEINYIRDNKGQALVEREITYLPGSSMPDIVVTIYIYGPRGLFGFIRQNEFYSVITDHEGSTRLVLKNGQVVAAYDYLPYGSLHREFIEYPEADISYRYTGKEWDKEIELYNFNARLYDPDIGRFYQVDPREQYSSPYVYAGNSPVSVIDPDGEFAILLALVIIGLIVGAYLGGAAANKTWNIANWNWSSPSTWLGIIGGGITGALIPIGFIAGGAFVTGWALAARLAVGVGVAYISAAGTNGSWNPKEWDWTSPETYYAAYSGIGSGSGLFKAYIDASSFYKTLTTVGKISFVGSAAAFGLGTLYFEAGESCADPSKPKFWSGLFQGLYQAPSLPMLSKGAGKLISRLRSTRLLEKAEGLNGLKKAFIKSFKNRESAFLYSLKAAFISGTFTVQGIQTNWNMTSLKTYYNLVNGVIQGPAPVSIMKDMHIFKMNHYKEERIRKMSELTEQTIRIIKDLELKHQGSEKYFEILDEKPLVIFSHHVDDADSSVIISGDNNSPIIYSDSVVEGHSLNQNVNKILHDVKKNVPMELKVQVEQRFTERIEANVLQQAPAQNIADQFKTQLRTGEPVTKYQLLKALKKGMDSSVEIKSKFHRKTIIEKELRILRQVVDHTFHDLPLRITEAFKIFSTKVHHPKTTWQIAERRRLNLEEAIKSVTVVFSRHVKKVIDDIWKELAFYDQTIAHWYSFGEKPMRFDLPNINIRKIFVYDCRLRDLIAAPTHSMALVPVYTRIRYDQISTTPALSSVSSVNFLKNVNRIVRTNSKPSTSKHTVFPLYGSSNEPAVSYPQSIKYRDQSHFRKRRSTSEVYEGISNTKLTQNNNAIENDKKGLISQWLSFSVAKAQEFIGNNFGSSNITKVDASCDVNGIFLLLNMFVRKATGEKFVGTQLNNTTPMVALGCVISVIHEFENMLKKIATELNLIYSEFDQISTMRDLRKHIMNGNYSKIPEILYKTALKVIPDSEHSMKFLNSLQYHLDKMLTQNSSKFLPSGYDNDGLVHNKQPNKHNLEINVANDLSTNDDIWFDANSTFLLS